MCTQKPRMAVWDMNNTRFLTLWLSNLLSCLSFSTGKHISMASSAILSIVFEKQLTQNHPQYLSGLSRALFPTTLLEIAVCGLCFVLCCSSHDRNLIFSFFFLQLCRAIANYDNCFQPISSNTEYFNNCLNADKPRCVLKSVPYSSMFYVENKTKPKKTTTITSIFGSRSVIDYFDLSKNHRPDPKQMAEGSNRPLVFQNWYMRAVFWIMSQFA